MMPGISMPSPARPPPGPALSLPVAPDLPSPALLRAAAAAASERPMICERSAAVLPEPAPGFAAGAASSLVLEVTWRSGAVSRVTNAVPGRLYEIDARLRPDGAKGLLVTSLDGYAAYMRERAWTWEQQALVRSSVVAGDAELAARFEALRAGALGQPRDVPALRSAVAAMRSRLRAQLDRSAPGRFDLKQGQGGLVDLEFLLQFLVLAHGHRHPGLLAGRGSAGLLAALAGAGVLPEATARDLAQAHADLLARALVRTLDERPRVVPPDPAIESARRCIGAAWTEWLDRPAPPAGPGDPADIAS